MSLPALLFDLDGTIVDSIELIVQAADFAFDGREGPRPTREEWVALIGTPLAPMLRRWAHDEGDVKFLWDRYRAFQVEHHDRLVAPYPGVVELIRRLHARGHAMAIVSSKIEAGIRRSLDYIGVTDCFGALIGIEATEKHKPDPEPVLLALERLGVTANHAWFIGDSPHDIYAGHAAGVKTIGVLTGPYDRETMEAAKPLHLVTTLAEMEALV
ncbi:MAG: HAD-IA family hydrolase [Gemmatimonadetes bacterium]|nr:HAD-IA family hydrolase [Gemmatimonadota bacterium]